MLNVVSAVTVNTKHEITLLSVTEYSNGSMVGDLAYLDLQIRPGAGSVFLDSFPATRIDTQVSARMANEIACEKSRYDCSEYDFFYTIRAEASTIGGPSAGAAITLLTLSALEDAPLKDKLAVTGAISSGGIIMPVDGIKEKVDAAENNGYDLVIIPKLAISPSKNNSNQTNATNTSFNYFKPLLQSDFENNTIEIFEATTLGDAFQIATKEDYVFDKSPELRIPDEYFERMKLTADKLCGRSEELLVSNANLNESELERANEFLDFSVVAKDKNLHYSRASYCYSANVELREKLLESHTQGVLLSNLKKLNQSRLDFENEVDKMPLETFSDLETYSIVKERLLESKRYIDALNQSNISASDLSSAIERYYSAVVWSGFFGMDGESLNLDENSIKKACNEELQNVHTRNNYLQTFIPNYLLKDLFLEISEVNDYIRAEEYELCLFKASKAKSYADYLITGATLNNDTIAELTHVKQGVAKELIANQQTRQLFPILGYSYYEYSQALEEDSYYSALMFAENSIALSDLSKYFEKSKPDQKEDSFSEYYSNYLFFGLGLIVGLILGFVFFRSKSSKNHKKHLKKSRK